MTLVHLNHLKQWCSAHFGEDVMQILALIVQTIKLVFGTLILAIFYGIYALIPASWLPKKQIRNELVLITGAGNGLGRLLAVDFATRGARLILWDINDEWNSETARLCRSNGAAEVRSYKVDLSSREDTYRVANLVKTEAGDVDILINNAGIVVGKKFIETPDVMNEKTMAVNMFSHYWTVKSFLPSMLKRDHGHIVSIASIGGMVGGPNLADYCASKFAAVGFMESMVMEIRLAEKYNVMTTVVCPWYMNTGMFAGAVPGMIPMLEPDYVAKKTIDAILTNQRVLFLPRMLYFLYFIKSFLPVYAGIYMAEQMDVLKSMDSFTGRK